MPVSTGSVQSPNQSPKYPLSLHPSPINGRQENNCLRRSCRDTEAKQGNQINTDERNPKMEASKYKLVGLFSFLSQDQQDTIEVESPPAAVVSVQLQGHHSLRRWKDSNEDSLIQGLQSDTKGSCDKVACVLPSMWGSTEHFLYAITDTYGTH